MSDGATLIHCHGQNQPHHAIHASDTSYYNASCIIDASRAERTAESRHFNPVGRPDYAYQGSPYSIVPSMPTPTYHTTKSLLSEIQTDRNTSMPTTTTIAPPLAFKSQPTIYQTDRLTPGSQDSHSNQEQEHDERIEFSGDDCKDTRDSRSMTKAELRAVKRKMKRFRLTHHQTRFLVNEFTRQAHPDAAHREHLARKIPGLSARQVQVWFQNRRAKLKRLTNEDQERVMRSRAFPAHLASNQALYSAFTADTGVVSLPMPVLGTYLSYGEHDVGTHLATSGPQRPQYHQYRQNYDRSAGERPTLGNTAFPAIQFTSNPMSSDPSTNAMAEPILVQQQRPYDRQNIVHIPPRNHAPNPSQSEAPSASHDEMSMIVEGSANCDSRTNIPYPPIEVTSQHQSQHFEPAITWGGQPSFREQPPALCGGASESSLQEPSSQGSFPPYHHALAYSQRNQQQPQSTSNEAEVEAVRLREQISIALTNEPYPAANFPTAHHQQQPGFSTQYHLQIL